MKIKLSKSKYKSKRDWHKFGASNGHKKHYYDKIILTYEQGPKLLKIYKISLI